MTSRFNAGGVPLGKRVAQVPRRSATLGATWIAPGDISLTPRVRWIDRQFEDDENALRLGEVVVADLGVSRPLAKHVQLFLSVENLGSARVETGRSADGVVNIGTPASSSAACAARGRASLATGPERREIEQPRITRMNADKTYAACIYPR